MDEAAEPLLKATETYPESAEVWFHLGRLYVVRSAAKHSPPLMAKAYEALGVRDENGNFQQLSACRLQIENEYYSTVRPKQIPQTGELPIHALRERGIRYLELRSVDVNLLDPAGLNLHQIAMLEMLET